MRILVTGSAGFIGFHAALSLLERGHQVLGLDNLNDYYPVPLKRARTRKLEEHPAFRFQRLDLADPSALRRSFRRFKPHRVVHLAAQAGVRYSLREPRQYMESNIMGFFNLLECCREGKVENLVYASSSSVYGTFGRIPSQEDERVDKPMNLYAATKICNELMAFTYSRLHGLPAKGLRFFTVYGPWGRPDMAVFQFAARILAGKPINLYGRGKGLWRDFTYIDDITQGVVASVEKIQAPIKVRPKNRYARALAIPHRVYNIGHHEPVRVGRVVAILEKLLGKKAKVRRRPVPPTDVPITFAQVDRLGREAGFKPAFPIEEGLARFTDWYLTEGHRFVPAGWKPK
ncbi:MAG TPA: NAD-dependent epimerase/dehydratase family protein [bacterium]|nr:NAD-dependent epimerase/dehydratase family protein [bacterium]